MPGLPVGSHLGWGGWSGAGDGGNCPWIRGELGSQRLGDGCLGQAVRLEAGMGGQWGSLQKEQGQMLRKRENDVGTSEECGAGGGAPTVKRPRDACPAYRLTGQRAPCWRLSAERTAGPGQGGPRYEWWRLDGDSDKRFSEPEGRILWPAEPPNSHLYPLPTEPAHAGHLGWHWGDAR